MIVVKKECVEDLKHVNDKLIGSSLGFEAGVLSTNERSVTSKKASSYYSLKYRDGKQVVNLKRVCDKFVGKPSSARPLLPEILPPVAHDAASKGDYLIRPLDRPMHS